ncbi:MAG: mandelate racemase/muconate lactonizing enzyme family protein [Clostridia bacterium]|nr:mandelate racemase/muconate lactonizing enzyme family protein [Oscillospiraceae bacterium]MBQ2749574.1 mandelate racemase/muconate lactonizing enzyme family protein [Clostridia bacterium]MBQ4623692.1 mandelate racemase/muconate lactonizing enzyme family protein [Clostridia bacterium]MBQ6990678.1 mandelate racemase/muconate lactonizing enzyme family protein [Clostridia bacterium]
MKIIDIKSALIGYNLTLRIVTDKGVDGYAQVEENRSFLNLKPVVEFYKNMLIGCDPTDVENCMRRIRRVGAFKPWGKVVSTIEMALWDIAGKEAGVPVYKLLGGKVRDKVRVYCSMYATDKLPYPKATTPEERAENILALNEMAGFTIVKSPVAFHNQSFARKADELGFAYDSYLPDPPARHMDNANGSMLTEKGLNYLINYVATIKERVGDKVGIAFDCGPGLYPNDAYKFAKAVEPYNVMWLEDLITGDYTPYNMAKSYRDITIHTTTNIHTGEQIYLRQNYKELIETEAVNVVGPDPADVGGIAELKWIAEYANLHGIHMAPHGIFDGVFGMAALMHVTATMPNNFIAFEFPEAHPEWWYDIVDGIPNDYFKDGHVKVWDKPGLGVEFIIPKAEKYLLPEDKDFFL